MVRPPRVTSSVPTVPEAEDESPYEIFQVEPLWFWNVLELAGLKMVCPVPYWLVMEEGSSLDQTLITKSIQIHSQNARSAYP